MTKAKICMRYLLIFLLGAVCGGGAVWQVSWGVMSALMGTRGQAKYRAVDASMDAYWQTKLLSQLRLGETQDAIGQAEWILDGKTIQGATWAKEAHDPSVDRIQRGQLGAVKRYRTMYPAQSEFKETVAKILSVIPDLPEPKPGLSAAKMTPITRLHVSRK